MPEKERGMSEFQVREMFRVLSERPTTQERERWASTRLSATIWCCDDEYDGLCYQPQIDRLTPNRTAGYPWIHREQVWSGTFVNEPTSEEYANLSAELREAAGEHGIELIEREGFMPHGERVEKP